MSFTYLELLDRTTYLNHYYLVSIVAALMLPMPLGEVFSFDAWRRKNGKHTLPRWPLYVLRAQLGLVYVFAGVAKLRRDWLFEAEPLHTWLSRYSDAPIVGAVMDDWWLAYAMSWAGATFDLTIVVFLLWRRSRPLAYAAVILFHAVTSMLFHKLRMLPTQPDMILSFAHYLRDRWAEEGKGPVAVRADAWVSLNGRRAQRLLDPTVDLGAVEDGLSPKDWIRPLR